MRSLLFVPADGGSKLDKAFASGADAVIVDLEDSIAIDRKDAARASAAAFIKKAVAQAKRPRLLVRVNGIATGLTDADLDAIVPARPDAILLPKAEGGASVDPCRRQARRARGHRRDRRRPHQDPGAGDRDRRRDFPRRHLQRRERPPDRHDLGTGGSVGRARRRDQSRRRTAGSPSPISSRARCACSAPPPRRPPRSRRSMPTSAISTGCGATPRKRAATASPAGWRSIRRRSRSSTRCSRRPPKRSRRRARSWRPSPRRPDAGAIAIDGVMYDRPHLARARQMLARAGEASK